MLRPIDLRSDTVTKPSEAMRMAMYRAEVGDDVYGDDPTVNRLEELGAEMAGKEAALFVTSGTQGNLVALLTHCDHGDEVILEAQSHIYIYEVGGMAAIGGLMPRCIHGKYGFMEPEEIEANIRPENVHFPRTRLLCLENTHNRWGGTVITVKQEWSIKKVADKYALRMHLDGARALNAAVALGCSLKELIEPFDSAQLCLSKGLGAPVGGLLVGSKDFIDEARRYRKMLGGGMRQAGVIAAAGIVALQENSGRLAEDHQNAKRMAKKMENINGVSLDMDSVQTNIVYFDIDANKATAHTLVSRMAERGILANAVSDDRVRLVTHVDVTSEDCDKAIDIIADIING